MNTAWYVVVHDEPDAASVHGPFPDRAAAAQWAGTAPQTDYTIVRLLRDKQGAPRVVAP